MRPVSALSISVLLLAFSSHAARAQGFDFEAQDSCEQAVGQQIKADHPSADNIGYSNPKSTQVETQTSVKGKGHFDGDGRKASFTYSCTYDIRTGDASDVHVHMDNATASN